MAWTAEGGDLLLRLAYDRESMAAVHAAGDTARTGELFGDRTVRSDHPRLDDLGVRVADIELGWRPAAIRYWCG